MTPLDLHGRVALITGAAGGIGAAIATQLGAAGARLALADLDEARARSTADSLGASRIDAVGFGCDVSDPSAVQRLVDAVLRRFGRIDILVNNAGIMGRTAPLWELTDEDWQRVMSVDLDSVFYVSRAVITHMRTRGTGCIVSIASIAGKEGTPTLVPYSVAKAGIIAFTKALGKEVVREGIRVNCVAPGVVETAILKQLPASATQTMLSKVPMGRLGTAEEVASVVSFLVSDGASFITAQCFDASGGRATY